MCPSKFEAFGASEDEKKSDNYLNEVETNETEQNEISKLTTQIDSIEDELLKLDQKEDQDSPDVKMKRANLNTEKIELTAKLNWQIAQVDRRLKQEEEYVKNYNNGYNDPTTDEATPNTESGNNEKPSEERVKADDCINQHRSLIQINAPQEEIAKNKQESIRLIAKYIISENPELANNPQEAERIAKIIFAEKMGYTDNKRSQEQLKSTKALIESGYVKEAAQSLLKISQTSTFDETKTIEEYEQMRESVNNDFLQIAQRLDGNSALATKLTNGVAKDRELKTAKQKYQNLQLAQYHLQNNTAIFNKTTVKNLKQAAEASGGADIIAKALASNTVYERDGVVTIPFDEQTDITIDQRGTVRVGKVAVSSLEPNVFDKAYIQNLAENQQLSISGIPDSEQLFKQLLRVNTADINRITAKEGEVVIALLKALGLQKESTSEVSSVFKELGIVNANNKLDPVKTHLLRTYLVQTTNLDPQKIKDNVSREAIKTFMAAPKNTAVA